MQSIVINAMKRLTVLHTLALMGAHMMNKRQMESFVKALFAASPSLVWFVFAGGEWNRAINFSMIPGPKASCDWNKY